jgi:hypothetical protein
MELQVLKFLLADTENEKSWLYPGHIPTKQQIFDNLKMLRRVSLDLEKKVNETW